jgi:hypothetical protein
MENLIGLLFIAIIVIGIVTWILIMILRGLFKGVAKVGGAVGGKIGGAVADAGTVTKALITDDYRDLEKKRKKNKNMGKKVGSVVGSAAGVVGATVLGADVLDGAGGDTDINDTNNIGSDDIHISGNEIDLDNDGRLEGYDTTGDGVIDTNVDGVKITGLESVDGYTKADGTRVDGYVRTTADGSTANNLRPKGMPRWKWRELNGG